MFEGAQRRPSALRQRATGVLVDVAGFYGTQPGMGSRTYNPLAGSRMIRHVLPSASALFSGRMRPS
jgi:hypothetical protein